MQRGVRRAAHAPLQISVAGGVVDGRHGCLSGCQRTRAVPDASQSAEERASVRLVPRALRGHGAPGVGNAEQRRSREAPCRQSRTAQAAAGVQPRGGWRPGHQREAGCRKPAATAVHAPPGRRRADETPPGRRRGSGLAGDTHRDGAPRAGRCATHAGATRLFILTKRLGPILINPANARQRATQYGRSAPTRRSSSSKALRRRRTWGRRRQRARVRARLHLPARQPWLVQRCCFSAAARCAPGCVMLGARECGASCALPLAHAGTQGPRGGSSRSLPPGRAAAASRPACSMRNPPALQPRGGAAASPSLACVALAARSAGAASTSGRGGTAERAAPRARLRRAAYGNEVRTRPDFRAPPLPRASRTADWLLAVALPAPGQTSEAAAAVVTPDTLWTVRAARAARAACAASAPARQRSTCAACPLGLSR